MLWEGQDQDFDVEDMKGNWKDKLGNRRKNNWWWSTVVQRRKLVVVWGLGYDR